MHAQELLADAMAEDLGVPADALEPQMAAAATVTIFDPLGDRLTATSTTRRARRRARAGRPRAVFIDGGIAALHD